MSDIADAMHRLVQDRLGELNVDLADELEKRRGAVTEFDKELAKFQGRDLSEADVLQFQALVNKRNQAYEMLSQLLQEQQQAINTIVNNMR